MNKKSMHLIAGVLASLVFIGYMVESGPHEIFEFEISIWVIRFIWLIIAITNFKTYFDIKKTENQS